MVYKRFCERCDKKFQPATRSTKLCDDCYDYKVKHKRRKGGKK